MMSTLRASTIPDETQIPMDPPHMPGDPEPEMPQAPSRPDSPPMTAPAT